MPFSAEFLKVPNRLSTISYKDTPVTVHLLSDRTGETLDMIWPAVKARFPENGFRVQRYHRPDDIQRLTEKQFEEFMAQIIATEGRSIVFYTVESTERAGVLEAVMRARDIICVDPLAEAIKALTITSGQQPVAHGLIDRSEAASLSQVERAALFCERFDDGKELELGFQGADIFLVGQSRAGKSGLAAYLALRKYNVANLPFVSGVSQPDTLKKLMQDYPRVKVVALVRDVSELVKFRRNRIRQEIGVGLLTPDKMSETERVLWTRFEDSYFGQHAVAAERRDFEHYLREAGVANILDITGLQTEEVATRLLGSMPAMRTLG